MKGYIEPGIRYHDKLTGRLFLNGKLVGYAKPQNHYYPTLEQMQNEYWDNLKDVKNGTK